MPFAAQNGYVGPDLGVRGVILVEHEELGRFLSQEGQLRLKMEESGLIWELGR